MKSGSPTSLRRIPRNAILTAMTTVVIMLGAERIAAAGPEDAAVCAKAAEDGQQLESDGKLVAAREQYVVCGRPTCPAVVVRDCLMWLAAVDKSLPTVVLSARRNGEDVVDARVLIDGKLAASSLGGKAIFVDPGVHAFTFEAGGERVEQRAVIGEGEKNRKVSVTFEGPVAVEPRTRAPDTTGARPVPVMTYVLGAVAIVAFGSAVGFGVAGRAQLDDLHRCAPACADSDVSALRRDMVITDVSLGVGAIAAVAAAWIFFTRSSVPAAAARGPSSVITW